MLMLFRYFGMVFATENLPDRITIGENHYMLRQALLTIIYLLIGIGYPSLTAQSAIQLDDCNTPYVDPQEAGDNNGQNRDTLFYETFFSEPNQARYFYVDINAFGGQQTDRTKVFAILPDSTLKLMGSLEFGSCVDCVTGFALVDNNEVQVTGVSDQNTMNMWLVSLGQPAYELPGNLQTLVGVGRISGRLPVCAIGLYVEYSVFSNPNNASTEFATYIHCPELIGDCAPQLSTTIDCPSDSLFLSAQLNAACFAPGTAVLWTDRKGWSSVGLDASRALSGNLGMYYFEVLDSCCIIVDSVLVEVPPFAMAGLDVELCSGAPLLLNGNGGMEPFWELADQSINPGQDLQIPALNLAAAGNYVYHAFDANGCEDTDTLQVMVNAPQTPELLATSPCFGDTLFLDVANEQAFQQFDWSHPNGDPLPNDFIINFQVDDTGAFGFAAVDTNDCAVTEVLSVSGAPLPAFDYLIEPNCDSTRVFVFPPTYTYSWSTGEEGDAIATELGGDFKLSITDAFGCQSSTEIAVPAPEGPGFEVVVEAAACPGEGANINIKMTNPDLPVIFSIDAGQTYSLTPEFSGLPPGKYGIQVQDDLGCTQNQTLIIPAPDTMGVRLSVDRLDVRPTTPISLTAETIGNIVAYQWVPDIIDTGGPSTEFIAMEDLDIRLIVEDEQGCRAVAGLPLSIVLGDIYVPDAFSPNGDGVNDGFTFYSDLGSGEQIVFLRIFDRFGGQVFSTENQALNEEAVGWNGRRFDGQAMPEGVYVYSGAVLFGNGYLQHLKGDLTLVR